MHRLNRCRATRSNKSAFNLAETELGTGNQDGLSEVYYFLQTDRNVEPRAYKPLLDALGLTYPQYLAMFALWEHDDLTVKELGELLHLDSGTLTPLLKRLEAMGLVRRARDTADERSVRINLTPAGIEMQCKERVVHEGLMGACGQSAEELKAITAQLVRVRENSTLRHVRTRPARRRRGLDKPGAAMPLAALRAPGRSAAPLPPDAASSRDRWRTTP